MSDRSMKEKKDKQRDVLRMEELTSKEQKREMEKGGMCDVKSPEAKK